VILLDTNVLVYALGAGHPLREPCRRIVQSAGRDVETTTTIEVVQQFLHVFGRRRPRAEVGIDLFERHAELSAFAALIAAAALNHDADALVTTDRSLAAVPGLRVVDPLSPELDTLLAR
jgi:predicted nucleic acid-binding protein